MKKALMKIKINKKQNDGSVTTLEDWKKVKVCDSRGNWNPAMCHPISKEIASFFRRVDKARKEGLHSVEILQQKLKLEDA